MDIGSKDCDSSSEQRTQAQLDNKQQFLSHLTPKQIQLANMHIDKAKAGLRLLNASIKNVEYLSSKDQVVKNITVITATDSTYNLLFLFDLSPFMSLTEVWLNRNQIISLENLAQMFMPNLKKLSLSHNNLISVKSLRKVNLPSIVQIQLDHNLYHDGYSLSEMKIQNKDLSFWLYFEQYQIEKQNTIKIFNAKLFPFNSKG